MKIFYDTEFLEGGKTIELISIGLVTEYNDIYYAVNSDAPWDRIENNDWLCEHVVPGLPLRTAVHKRPSGNGNSFSIDMRDSRVKPKFVIANEVRDFITKFDDVELWAYYGAYDHVALAQLWGRMIDLPAGVPMFTHEFKQTLNEHGNPQLPAQRHGEHNALDDALHLAHCYHWLTSKSTS